jgi:hypothetical protein
MREGVVTSSKPRHLPLFAVALFAETVQPRAIHRSSLFVAMMREAASYLACRRPVGMILWWVF